MWEPLRIKGAAILIAIALSAGLTAAIKPIDILDGPLYDLSLLARSLIPLEDRSDAAPLTLQPGKKPASGVAVIAVDPASLATPELSELPRALFAPHWADLIKATNEAGGRAIAFDLLFAFSGKPIDRHFDKPLQRALNGYGNKVVLGRSERLLPVRSFLAPMTRHAPATGFLELPVDGDGVVRKVPLMWGKNARRPTLSGAALIKAGYEVPETSSPVRLAPHHHVETIPTYALFDILTCAKTDPDRLADAISNRIVFVGTTLPEEDRKLEAGRFLPAPDEQNQQLSSDGVCQLEPLGRSASGGRRVPGVHVHAEAVRSRLADELVTPTPQAIDIILGTLMGLMGVILGLRTRPATAFGLALFGVAILFFLQTAALLYGHWLPTARAMGLLAFATLTTFGLRYLLVDRAKAIVMGAFAHYLAPQIVDRLAENPKKALSRGGELRDVTIMFADLSGFTALSETIKAEELVSITNDYLQLIADEVDASGGYIDKFIGDAVMAIWGAPVTHHDHAIDAVGAALAIREKIAARAAKAKAKGDHSFDIKIGIYTGHAVVGNVGSENRLNYTAVGAPVNIAARLEGLPAVYNTPIIIGDQTAAELEDQFGLWEIDNVRVKGRDKPVTLFAPYPKDDYEMAKIAADYHAALTLYRNREFDKAAKAWGDMKNNDTALMMSTRAARYHGSPPPDNWDGVFTMSGK